MTAQQTSIDGFKALNAHSIGARQKQVLDTLKNYGGLSNREISLISRIPINVVTPRVLELRKMGIIIPLGTKKDPQTGFHVNVWGAIV